MQELGLIRKATEIGYGGDSRFIWLGCIDCGRPRWVRLKAKNEPSFLRCRKCANSKIIRARGEEHHNWKGGRYKTKAGYVLVRLQPDDFFYSMVKKDGNVLEHRLVMAGSLQRCLLPWEIVHHLNGIRGDNRIENLELLPAPYKHDALTRLATRVERLEARVTLLEAENIILKEVANANL